MLGRAPALGLTAALLFARPAAAQTGAGMDLGQSTGRPARPTDQLPFRDSWFVWDHAATAQTVGLGRSYQSANPTYEMSGSLRPRYYFAEGERDAWYLAGRADVIHEFTNSDVTTRRGETTLGDFTAFPAYRRTLREVSGYTTSLAVAAPILTVPTSKFSYSNGTYLGLGTDVRLVHEVPLAGRGSSILPELAVWATVGYNHTFTRAVVPTNPELRRVRLDPEGRTVPGDQLTGAAFPEHELKLSGRVIAAVTDRLFLLGEVSYRPTWKYAFGDIRVCGVVTTGCATVTRPDDPVRYVVVTGFEAGFAYDVVDALSVSLGYTNVATQPGPDGQRRSIFYGPGAQVSLSFVAHLDVIYAALSGPPATSHP